MKDIEEAINKIKDDATLTGKEAKELMIIVKEYVETEVRSKELSNRFLQTIINHYKNKETSPST